MRPLKTLLLAATAAVGLTAAAPMAHAAGAPAAIEDFDFPFEGPLGTYDRDQLQRGLQVYTEICSACHGLRLVAFRTLADPGGPSYSEDEMRAYAETFEIYDAEIDDWRPATPTDHYPGSLLENAPDLSLMAKARAGFSGPYGTGINQLVQGIGGPEYIASLLIGYVETPECGLDADLDGAYNKYFTAGAIPDSCKDEDGNSLVDGSWIAMGQPLWGDDVFYADETEATIEQQAEDVAAFLMWAAEPKLAARKQAGLTGVGLLALLAVMLYLTNKQLWAPIKHRQRPDDE
ncbi:MAG: cytochrome c1 [Pseudomonadota bacterium]